MGSVGWQVDIVAVYTVAVYTVAVRMGLLSAVVMGLVAAMGPLAVVGSRV